MSKIEGQRARSLRVLASFAETIRLAEERLEEELEVIKDVSACRNYSEKTWVVMLTKQKIIAQEDGTQILRALLDYEKHGQENIRPVYTPSNSFSVWSLEKVLTQKLGEDLAGNINIGKTLPEPIARLKIRDKMVETMESVLNLLSVLLEVASSNKNSVMPGYTHLAQAQVMTFGHYLVSVHDPIARAMQELEAAYKNTNVNTLGCGALAGSSWPLDRKLVADLLGFDDVLENTNDCVASADYCISILAALTNIMLTVSRLTLDLQIWGMEEIKMIGVPESYSDTSSMMPQKKNYGGQLERIRLDSAAIISRFQEAAVLPKNEPYADMLAVLRTRYPVLEALCIVEKNLTILSGFLSTIIPHKEKMLQLAKRGFASASELANIIVRKRSISYRKAHHIAGTLVRLAEEQGIAADEVTAELLDQAATLVIDKALHFSDAEVREALDPTHFVEAHNILGAVSATEVERMIHVRKERIENAQQRQRECKERLKKAAQLLEDEISLLVKN